MFKIVAAMLIIICTLALSREPTSDISISFFEPMSGQDVTEIGEGSFSVPNPIVVVNPIVLGRPEEHLGKTAIYQIDADHYQIRVTGRVYDFLADSTADGYANIEYVTVNHSMHALTGRVAVTALDSDDARLQKHPLSDELAQIPALARAIRPYPFTGYFESEVFTLPINTGFNAIYVQADNINGGYSVASVEIRATVNRQENKYDIKTEVDNTLDIGLYNPVLVYIDDPNIDSSNIERAHASINGVRVGLRFIEGQLQLDRPIIGIGNSPPTAIPNIVNVVGQPKHFRVKYKNIEASFGWSYTTQLNLPIRYAKTSLTP